MNIFFIAHKIIIVYECKTKPNSYNNMYCENALLIHTYRLFYLKPTNIFMCLKIFSSKPYLDAEPVCTNCLSCVNLTAFTRSFFSHSPHKFFNRACSANQVAPSAFFFLGQHLNKFNSGYDSKMSCPLPLPDFSVLCCAIENTATTTTTKKN